MKPSPVNPPAGSIPCSRKLMRGIITVEVDLSKAVYRSITGEAMCRSRPIKTCRTSVDNSKSAGSSVWVWPRCCVEHEANGVRCVASRQLTR